MIYFLIAFFVCALLVLCVGIREFMCWYFKQDEIILLLKELKEQLKKNGTTCAHCKKNEWTRYYGDRRKQMDSLNS